MPRIRKRTSKRGTTNQREKIKHKVSETRKKRKKDVKKKPQQWKSKNPKDPGIPNTFPYKDQILAEVAEQRRQAEEAKQRRKEEKKAAKTGEVDAEGDVPVIGVTTLLDQRAASSSSKTKVDKDTTGDEQVPLLMSPDLPTLKAVLDIANVVLEVLDARDPWACRSSFLEEYVKSRSGVNLALVLNKIDACPREAVQSWATTLQNDHPTFLFRSASGFLPSSDSGKGKAKANDALGLDSILEYLARCAEELGKEEPLVVAVVGLTNVGKSSFVNSLVQQSILPIYALSSTQPEGPTTTPYAQEVPLDIAGKHFRIVDTPGVSWQLNTEDSEKTSEETRAGDILTRSRGRIDRLKDPLPVVARIVTRANKEDLMLFYNIPAFSEGDVDGFLAAVARSNNLLKKGGKPDSTSASRIVLRDWGTGKLPRYTVPPTIQGQTGGTVESKSETILSTLTSRKELRKTSGLVKLKPGEIDSRKVDLEKPWVKEANEDEDEEEGSEEEAENSDEDEGEDEGDNVESDSDEEEEEEDESDEEEAPPVGKRKRGPVKLSTKPAKKVAFSVESKRQRGAPPSAKAATKPAIPLKSSLKIMKKTPKKPTAKPSKAANSSEAKSTPKTAGGEEAYDFGKFF